MQWSFTSIVASLNIKEKQNNYGRPYRVLLVSAQDTGYVSKVSAVQTSFGHDISLN